MYNISKILTIVSMLLAGSTYAASLSGRWQRTGVSCASGQPVNGDWGLWRVILDFRESPFYTMVKTREGSTFFETGEFTVDANNQLCLINDFYDVPAPICYDLFLNQNTMKLGEQINNATSECEQGDYLIKHYERTH